MKYVFVGLFAIIAQLVSGQESVKLWTKNNMPYSKVNSLIEEQKEVWGTTCVCNVTEPELYIYNAQGENSGKAVIILPGGGYEVEAINHEGHDVAKLFAQHGITAAVLKYRLPLSEASDSTHLLPITDTQRALEILRQSSNEYGFDKSKLGVLGFSAGAHLAAYACMKENQKPNFSLLIYGCWILEAENSKWLENKLFHREMTKDEYEDMNILQRISFNTPPAFLVHALDDKICSYKETTLYAQMLGEKDVEHELHLFSNGGHGFGLGNAKTGTDKWIQLAINWIKRL